LEITRIQREPLVAEYYSRTRGPLELNLPPLEDAHSVQLALSMVLFALGQNRIDLKRAAAILYTLQIAATNVRSLPADEPNSVRDIVTDETGAVLAPEDPEDPEDPEENQAHPTHADTSQSAFAAQLDAELDAEEQADNEAWLQQQAEEQAREAAWQQSHAQKRAEAEATTNTTPLSLNAAADPETPSTPYSLLPTPYSLPPTPQLFPPPRTPFVRNRTSHPMEGLALRAATLKESHNTMNILNTYKTAAVAATLAAALCLTAAAQEPNPTTIAPGARSADVVAQGPNGVYIYHVKVVERQLDAVNYLNRSGSTHIGFRGTNLMPNASGDAKVNAVTGKIEIDANFKGLTPANGFGPEYLTYVLWAISADGRPQNLGELELAGDKASLKVTTAFQAFGMIVTAEPYYAVSQPSDVVVLQNVFNDATQGVQQQVNVHYQLLPRGLYADTAGAHSQAHPITDREHTPLALFEAYNAQRIAESVGADQYAPDIMKEVAQDIENAQAMQDNKHRDVKMEFTYARSAVQRSEDARLVTLRKQAEERQQQAQEAKVAAQQQAQQSQLDAAQAQAQADAAAAAQAKAEAAKAQADAEAANARAQAAAAQQQAQASEQEAAATREKLRTQLNSVLATTESARGLIVNLSDVLFDTGKYTLKPDTKIALAKVATILTLYPGLKVQVEGYTDSVGSDAYNQTLSENRANAVQTFLVSNGVPAANVTAAGYGKANPVADNTTAAGRAQNRRVNLVVSGDAIGVETTKPTATPQ
jgi:outer membrane protein OmpA-like peptidoglycan-associated protein